MSFDYSNGALDWNNTNDPENKFFNSAVSNIAKAAGVCIDTQYGKEESAAYTFLAAHELAYRFGYSVNCQALKSKYYTVENWLKLLQEQIQNNQPIIYNATTQYNIGHAFVVDGYNESQYFHINWGWDGVNNGFYDLNALSVNNQTFLDNHEAIINIIPDKNPVLKCSSFFVNDSYYAGHELLEIDYFNCSHINLPSDSEFTISCPTLLTNHFSKENENLIYYYLFGIGVFSKNGQLKYIIPHNQIADTYFDINSNGEIQSRLACRLTLENLTLQNQTEEGDRYQLLVKEKYGESEWQIVQGTSHCPASFQTTDNRNEYVKFDIKLDNNLSMYYDGITFDGNQALKNTWISIRIVYGGPSLPVVSSNAYYAIDQEAATIDISTIATEPKYYCYISYTPSSGLVSNLNKNQTVINGIVYEAIPDNHPYFFRYGNNSSRVVGYTHDISKNAEILDYATINGINMPVKLISPGAFRGADLHNITISTNNTVNIYSAFAGCNHLESITLSENFHTDYFRFMTFKIPNFKYLYNNSTKIFPEIAQELYYISRLEGKTFDVFSSRLDYNILENSLVREEITNIGKTYIPGALIEYIKLTDGYYYESALPFFNFHEMWEYAIDRKNGAIKVKALIDGLVIDGVTINGVHNGANPQGLYNYNSINDANPDVIVEYTLHKFQSMTTHYTPEFNTSLPDSDLGFVPVSEISLNPSSVTGKEGDQIQLIATVLPEDATNKILSWNSSNESVVTVDGEGLISLIKDGAAVLTASATDGSGVSAECAVIVSGSAGIEDVLSDKTAYVKIFTLSGILVYEGIYSEANLAPDYYILVCEDKNVKVKVE